MVGVDARRVAAEVVEGEAVWDGSDEEFSGDTVSPDDFEDDRILNAIIQSGKDESTDCLIKCL